MKTIKSFNNKFISSLLAFVVLLAGIFSFSSIKTKTASADDILVPAIPFTAENIYDFGFLLARELNLPIPAESACLLVDSALLTNGDESFEAYSLSDVEGLPFFVGFAQGLVEHYTLGSVTRTTSTLTIEEIFNACELEVVVYYRNSTSSTNTKCVNLTTGEQGINISTVQRFFEEFDYDINDSSFKIYAVGVWTITNRFETFLDRMQSAGYAIPFYVFPKEDVYDGEGLLVSVYTGSGFYPEYSGGNG